MTASASCKVEWHTDATCEQFRTWREENDHAEDLFAVGALCLRLAVVGN